MKCSRCSNKIGLYGMTAVRISGEPDINLCPDCKIVVKNAISNALFIQSVNNVGAKVKEQVLTL